MAEHKISEKRRESLPASEMGQPATHGYPMPDKKHARLAKSGASHAEHVGNISPAQKATIDAKANRILMAKAVREHGK